MSSISPYYRTITQLLQSRSYSIDVYQREYKWDTANIQELLSDLQNKFETSYRDGDSPKETTGYADYFLGSIIVARRGTKSYLVDGQQRVTSLTLLLIYLYRSAKELGLTVSSTVEPLIFSDNLGDQSFNLDIPDRTPVIKALFNGDHFNPDGKDESLVNILARYRDIEEYNLSEELGDALPVFIYWLLNNVGLIEITTDSDAHAYSIFEAMNDRGKPLSPVDMLKAYLLTPIDDEDARAEANRRWKRAVVDLTSWPTDPDNERDAVMIKAWLRAQYAVSVRDRKAGASDRDWELIGTTFHRWVRDNATHLGIGDSNSNLRLMTEEFEFYARAYKTILEAASTFTAGLESVYYNSHNEFTWQNTVLLAPLDPTDDADTVRRKIEATAAYLDIWVMRRTVNYVRVGYSAVSYAMWLLCKDIRRKSLDELGAILQEKLSQDDATFEGSSSRGRHGIEDLRLNQFSRRYIFHLLARVTSYVDVGAGRPDPFPTLVDRNRKNSFDIEHIWANKYSRYESQFDTAAEFDAWRDNVAALLLLPADVNRSYQDKDFETKAPHYAKQNFFAASLTDKAYQHQPQFEKFVNEHGVALGPFEHFGKVEQKQRSEVLLNLANRIWSPSRIEAQLR